MYIETVSVIELDYYIGRNDVVIIDIRNPVEYRKRHIVNALNYSMEDLDKINLSKELIYIFYCERGANSMKAAKKITQRGYKAMSLVGGISSYHGKYIV